MKKIWRKALLGGLGVVLAASLLAGCGSDTADNKDVLKLGVTNFADTLEPTDNFYAWVVMRYGIGETLTKFDKSMVAKPWIASKWSLADDKLTWTFTIDDKAKFSNGKKVTAVEVKESIERAFAKAKRASTFFETKKPMPNMPGLLADPLFLVVDVQAEKDGRNFAKEGPIATGPYTVVSYSKDKSVLKANENYWNGTVPFKTVEVPSIEDPNTRAMALQSGEVDMAVNIGPGEIDLFKGNDKFQVDEIASLRVVLARINQKGLLGDPKVRAAFISATDRQNYADVLLKGTFIPGKAPIPPSMDYGFNQLTDPNAYNPDRSKQLLAEAGWKDTDGDGILDKDGRPLSVNFVVYNSRAELPIFAEAVQADLRKVGVDVKIKTVDYTLIDKMGIDGDYDLLISNIVTANTGDSNPEYDAKLDALSTEFDPAVRRQLIIEAQQILLNDGAALFLGYPMTNIVANKALKGVVMFPSDYYWITKDIAK